MESATCTRLRLYQFRCHGEVEVRLEPGWHFFLGANGQGKTSLLEALFFLSRLRSWRAGRTSDLWQHDRDTARISADYAGQNLAVTWRAGRRELTVDQQPVAEAAAFWGRVPTVLFLGEDRELVTGPGQGRRTWIDGLLAKRDGAYLRAAQAYARTLRQRNAWLKERGGDPEVGRSLTRLLTEHGRTMTRARAAMSGPIGSALSEACSQLTGQREIVSLDYRPSFPPQGEPDWDRVRADEGRLRHTVLGPHRDDWDLLLGEGRRSLGRFGSEGQQRTAALGLRLAEARLIREVRGGWPLLLIDDIAPQLDESRQVRLRELLPGEAQCFFTAPEPRGWIRPGDHAWQVAPGRVAPMDPAKT
ncbi:MAG: DNA replication and repair protein RecF [Verrucomicrobiota bacterium]